MSGFRFQQFKYIYIHSLRPFWTCAHDARQLLGSEWTKGEDGHDGHGVFLQTKIREPQQTTVWVTHAVLDMPMPLQAPRREENNKSLDHIDLHCRCRFCHRLGTLGYLSSHRSAKIGYTFIHIIYNYLIAMFISNQGGSSIACSNPSPPNWRGFLLGLGPQSGPQIGCCWQRI